MTQEERLTAGRIAALQRKAWAKTWQHAQAHSPFFREHLRQAAAPEQALIPLDEIGRIPTIDKSVLSNNPGAFLCVSLERVVDIVTTSGSTGKPLVTMLTEADMQRLALNERQSFRCAGLTASDRVRLQHRAPGLADKMSLEATGNRQLASSQTSRNLGFIPAAMPH